MEMGSCSCNRESALAAGLLKGDLFLDFAVGALCSHLLFARRGSTRVHPHSNPQSLQEHSASVAPQQAPVAAGPVSPGTPETHATAAAAVAAGAVADATQSADEVTRRS